MTAADMVRQLAEATGTPPDGCPQPPSPTISIRIRTARNVSDFPFPGRCGMADRRAIRKKIVQALPELSSPPSHQLHNLTDFNKLQLTLLQECNLSTREHARARAGSAISFSPSNQLTVLINEEDHLRAHVIQPGNQIGKAWNTLRAFDASAQKQISFAKSAATGYFCASPLNTGSGLRISALMHLPALAIADRIGPIAHASAKLGFPFTGLNHADSAPSSCLFHVNSQQTQPGSEDKLATQAQEHIGEIERLEKETRQFLLESRPELVYDRISRAWALLRAARLLDTQEAIDNLMALRFGAAIGSLPSLGPGIIDDLFTGIRPAHLQFRSGKPLSKFVRDCERARIIQERLAKIAS